MSKLYIGNQWQEEKTIRVQWVRQKTFRLSNQTTLWLTGIQLLIEITLFDYFVCLVVILKQRNLYVTC